MEWIRGIISIVVIGIAIVLEDIEVIAFSKVLTV